MAALLFRTIPLVAALIGGAPVHAQTAAESYPSRPVRLVVAFPPGGPVDISARVIAQRMTEGFKQPVLVDNRAGAAGIVGTDLVAKSPPDGHTLLMAASTIAIQPTLYAKLPFDTAKDILPIASVNNASLLLVVHPSVPAKSVKELIALARARPGQLVYASPGTGTANHLAGEMMKTMGKFDAVHVPYKGGAPAEIDLMGGHASFMFATVSSSLPNVRAGRLRALAVSTAKRSAVVPDVPTIAEGGLPGFDASTWYGVVGPAGIPREVVARINTEINRVLQLADVKERMAALGLEPTPGTPEQFAEFIRVETQKWGKVIRDSGARAE